MSDDLLDIEVNGRALKARKGSMIIEATDAAGVLIPRFCYHKKLSVAANCRMCLVEVERAPKPLPACATPVMDGMKISTTSPYALKAQKSVMEFLLINHPLDCPICDQGGECELQDLAMGYGRDVSRFNERKRVVRDKDLGSLIATDMTRCIHCTRCVRFGDEIAGLPELGSTGRGENLEIGTYVTRAMESELSGNVIDVCPVGALTSKPFRFRARAWEVSQRDSISPHDAVGSNLHVHYKGNKVVRVVPKENDAVNEVWISDRDRFSYEGLYGDDRLSSPMIKQGDEWVSCDWDAALAYVAEGITRVREANGDDSLGALISPNSTVEEAYLTQKLLRALGSNNVDHRLRQSDFDGQGWAPDMPTLGQSLTELESSDAVLLVGTDCRREQPMANHRVRKAVLAGGRALIVNPVDFDFNYEVAHKVIADLSGMVSALAGIAKSVGVEAEGLASVKPSDAERAIGEALKQGQRPSVILGAIAASHPQATAVRTLAEQIAAKTDAKFGELLDGSNAAGAWIAGALPHRGPGGASVDSPGATAASMVAATPKGLLLLGIEPELDCYDCAAAARMTAEAEFVVVMTTHRSTQMSAYADVLLPTAPFTENEGTLINAEGRWQSFEPVVAPLDDARPAWKLLRVLGNLLSLEGFDYLDSASVCTDVKAASEASQASPSRAEKPAAIVPELSKSLCRVGNQPMYAVDTLVRRAPGLQATGHAEEARVRIHPSLGKSLSLAEGDRALAKQNGSSAEFAVQLDAAVPPSCVHLPAGLPNTVAMGPSYGDIELVKA
jgi:NADH-quinone oxidoreductase subunit G